MKNITIFLAILIFIPIVLSIECALRASSCNSGEFCLFSRYQENNSHVGNCSAYSFLTCCSDPYLKKVEIKSSCGIGENGTIAMFNYTNAHAEIYDANNYVYKVCVSCPWICTLRNNCLSDEYAIASLNATTNSHVASPGYYGNQVCCKRENISPSYSNLGQNSSSVEWGGAVKLYAYWQDNGNLSYAILSTNETGAWENKSVYNSPININANSGWSNFTWQNSSVYGGVTVAWKIYANDSCGNWRETSVNTFTINQIISYQISPKLSEGIFFTSLNGSKYNLQENININSWNNATWNYNHTPQPGDKKTLYWLYNSGNTPQDFCLKANTNLLCSTGECIGNYISADSIAWQNSTTNSETEPSFDTTKRLSTSYVKIAQNVLPNQYVYFRFWLFGETYKPSGVYNTTFTIKNVLVGQSC
ncbi:MAG: hypothetical protein N3E38_01810 [Candidatus Aenigmarchaeota archaeon]|nr:hypothetical protein [Candidatus Aenigmarchaeota archaeon]